MKINIIYVIMASVVFLGCTETKQKLGYETEKNCDRSGVQ